MLGPLSFSSHLARLRRSSLPFFALLSCGSPVTPAPSVPVTVAPAIPPSEELWPPPLLIESSVDALPQAPAFPDQCGQGAEDDVCYPPEEFAKEACGGYAKPAVALKLFAKG